MISKKSRLSFAVITSALLITASLAAAPAGESVSPDTKSPAHALAHEPCGEADPACTAAAEASRVDLATHLDIELDQIDLLRKDRVTWNDGSLGCPQPDRAYTQAVVNGLFIELRVCETSYLYHAGPAGKPFLCVQPQPADDGSRRA